MSSVHLYAVSIYSTLNDIYVAALNDEKATFFFNLSKQTNNIYVTFKQTKKKVKLLERWNEFQKSMLYVHTCTVCQDEI